MRTPISIIATTELAIIIIMQQQKKNGRHPPHFHQHCAQAAVVEEEDEEEQRRRRADNNNIPFKRTLLENDPKKVYHSRKGQLKTVIHWGQRKLLMSEIEFLHMEPPPLEQRCVVIYAGAAPGTHVAILSELFPEHRFILVDPATFTVRADGDRIITRQEMFTDDLAQRLKVEYEEGWHMLFVPDVRSSDYLLFSKEEDERRIKGDMEAQAQWHTILNPHKSMLKFRLPYTPGTTRYLKGDILLPVWGPITTTECRLVVAGGGKKSVGDDDSGEEEREVVEYDHTEHEQKMFYFNTVTRPAFYPHGVRGVGIDFCYDCRAEVGILRSILGPRAASNRAIARLSERISAQISSSTRTLAHPNPDPEERIRVIRRRQWAGGENNGIISSSSSTVPAYEIRS